MDHNYWRKQLPSQPLFPDLLWSRPESKRTAGKLLIVGGNIHSFSAIGQAYQSAQKAGIGSIRVLLPDALQKTVSKLLPDAFFAPSTPSGSFAQTALEELLTQAVWADAVLLSGDLGRNSETAILLEKFVIKFKGRLVITKDAVDYFSRMPASLLNRPQTCVALTIAQLQLMASASKYPEVFTFNSSMMQIIDKLHNFTTINNINVILKHLDTFYVAVSGQVSTTKTDIKDEESWRVDSASKAAVWWLQNPNKPFEAMTCSLLNNFI